MKQLHEVKFELDQNIGKLETLSKWSVPSTNSTRLLRMKAVKNTKLIKEAILGE